MQSGVHCAICCRNRWSLHGETSLFTCHLSVCNLGVALKSLTRQRELCNILRDKYFSREISVSIVIKKSDRTQNPIFSMQELHWNFNLASSSVLFPYLHSNGSDGHADLGQVQSTFVVEGFSGEGECISNTVLNSHFIEQGDSFSFSHHPHGVNLGSLERLVRPVNFSWQ